MAVYKLIVSNFICFVFVGISLAVAAGFCCKLLMKIGFDNITIIICLFMSIKFVGNTDVLDAIDAIVAAKGVSKDVIITAIEDVVAESTKAKFGHESDVIVKMSRKTGEMQIVRSMTVVENVTDIDKELDLQAAKKIDPEAELGGVVYETMPNMYIERSTVNEMKNVILKAIRSLERQTEFDEFEKRVGTIVTGFVKKATPYSCILGIGSKVEAVIPKDGMIFGERFSEHEKVTACIEAVNRSDTDFQIVLSRTSNMFLERMLREEVSEIEDGLVEIKGIVRDPGSRAKVVVWSADYKTDAVGACIGPRGSRIKNVINELKGEKVDIIAWDRDISVLAKNVIVPAKVSKVNVNKDAIGNTVVEIVVPSDQVHIAIGKRGQNVRLAAKLLECDVEIASEEERKAASMKKFENATQQLIKHMDLDDIVAQLLVSEGFATVEQIAEAAVAELLGIEGFNEEIATEIKERAAEHIAEKEAELQSALKGLEVDEQVKLMPNITKEMLIILVKNKVLTLQDLADLASDELVEMVGENLISQKDADHTIMSARKIVYEF